MNPIDIIRSECNEDDTLRAVIPTERDGNTLFVVVVREQPSENFDTAVHVRTFEVDLDEGQGHWTPNGAVFPADAMGAILPGLTVAKNALTSESGFESVLVKNGINGGVGGDELARKLLGVDEDEDTDSGESDEDEADEQTTLVEKGDVEPSERVTCDKCGREIARENAENFGGFGIGTDVFVCAEGCPE